MRTRLALLMAVGLILATVISPPSGAGAASSGAPVPAEDTEPAPAPGTAVPAQLSASQTLSPSVGPSPLSLAPVVDDDLCAAGGLAAKGCRPSVCGSLGNSYSDDTAWVLYQAASRAYEVNGSWRDGDYLDRANVATPIPLPDLDCFRLLSFVDDRVSTQVYVARNDDTGDLVVAFRGTEFESEPADIVADSKIDKVAWQLPDGNAVDKAVHEGFRNAYLNVQLDLKSLLAKHGAPERPGARVYFTGHSLGGALATLAALDLADDLMADGYSRSDVVLYTFGAPRSITENLLPHFSRTVTQAWAVANDADPVTHLPLKGLSNLYVHIPNMRAIVADGTHKRVEAGYGPNYLDCGLSSFGNHVRTAYSGTLNGLRPASAPSAYIRVRTSSIDEGDFEIGWRTSSTAPAGFCEAVGLFHRTEAPPQGGIGGVLRSRTLNVPEVREVGDCNCTGTDFTTSYSKGDNFVAGYMNIFGATISTTQYQPTTPRVWLQKSSTGLYVDLAWSVSDPGRLDRVYLYDHRPTDPNDYYTRLGAPVQARPTTNSPEGTLSLWKGGLGYDPWYVAYVQIDDFGNKRILAWAGPYGG